MWLLVITNLNMRLVSVWILYLRVDAWARESRKIELTPIPLTISPEGCSPPSLLTYTICRFITGPSFPQQYYCLVLRVFAAAKQVAALSREITSCPIAVLSAVIPGSTCIAATANVSGGSAGRRARLPAGATYTRIG